MPVSLRHFMFASVAVIIAAVLPGCEMFASKKPAPLEYVVTSPYPQVRTWAIAPAVNLSGSRDFDPLIVGDQLFEELHQVQGLNVLPLNKTIAVMQKMGIRSIDSPQTAQSIAETLHADGLVMVAVTAYDPYKPPVVGMSMQLYTVQTLAEADVVKAGPILTNANGKVEVRQPNQPVAQVSAVFDAKNQTVLSELTAYAAGRSDYQSGLQEQRYLADSDSYMHFVCHAMVRRLVEVERQRSGGQ